MVKMGADGTMMVTVSFTDEEKAMMEKAMESYDNGGRVFTKAELDYRDLCGLGIEGDESRMIGPLEAYEAAVALEEVKCVVTKHQKLNKEEFVALCLDLFGGSFQDLYDRLDKRGYKVIKDE